VLGKSVTVVANTAPSAAISAPANNASYTRSSSGTVAVSFVGTGTDVEDGALSGGSLVWTSSRDGQIGTGTSFVRSDLSVGTHTITLTAKDAQGLTGVVSKTVTILPATPAPIATFSFVCTGVLKTPHSCSFDATGSTLSGGVPSPFAWDFADGSVLATSALTFRRTWAAAGTYVVTLRVTDATGSSSVVSKSVIVP
jgi:PKD repeat protein